MVKQSSNAQRGSSKRSYSPPSLSRYGGVISLTASGTTGDTETNPVGQGGKQKV